MPKKLLGNAQYRAIRSGGITHLIAVGEAPNYTDKTDFEALPFLINPPIYGFFFIQQDVSIPAIRPFTYEEAISYPASARTVRIQNADGMHEINIKDLALARGNAPVADPQRGGYCVFSWIGTDKLLIAKCDAVLPAIYVRVFGPATHAKCEEHVKRHGGTGAPTLTATLTKIEALERTKFM